MADTLVERVTGRACAVSHPDSSGSSHGHTGSGDRGDRGDRGDSGNSGTTIEVQLVMTDRTLLRGNPEPAHLPGYGPVPAEWARDLVRGATTVCTSAAATPSLLAGAEVFLRRLFTHPGTGQLVAMESRARRFPDALRDFLVARDQTCRTPWCDAPVRHADHATDVAAGGATDADNGQGLCEQCNNVKTAPGWRARPSPGNVPGDHEVTTTTPTRHSCASRPPPQPGHTARHGTGRDSWIARHLTVVEPGPVELSFTDYVHGPAA